MKGLKTQQYFLLIFAVLLSLGAAGSLGFVRAQTCTAQLGSISASSQSNWSSYYTPNANSNLELTVPVLLTCPYEGGQPWVVGSVTETGTNTNLGSANAIMTSYGAYYSGRLDFDLPLSVVGQSLQVSVSVYSGNNNGQYGPLIASISPILTINPSNYYFQTTSNGYYNGYSNYCYYQNGYMYCPSPSNYYYSYQSSQAYLIGSCINGQAIVYYDGAYRSVNCYTYNQHH